MSDKVFVDTNVFVYLFDKSAPVKQAQARRVLEAEGPPGHIVLSTQVLQEFYVSVTRKLGKPMSEPDGASATQDLCAFDVVDVDKDMVLRSLTLSRTERMSFWDALIVEAAQTRRCVRLLTEDLQEGRRFGSLQVANPFRAAS